jgi:hypothetical protein
VVKAFNGIYASHLLTEGKPAGSPGRIALPVAGDDPTVKAVVIDLLDQVGFDGVDAGGLEDSWRQQPGTPVYGADLEPTASGVLWRRPTQSAQLIFGLSARLNSSTQASASVAYRWSSSWRDRGVSEVTQGGAPSRRTGQGPSRSCRPGGKLSLKLLQGLNYDGSKQCRVRGRIVRCNGV